MDILRMRLLNPDKFWLLPLKCKSASNWGDLRQTKSTTVSINKTRDNLHFLFSSQKLQPTQTALFYIKKKNCNQTIVWLWWNEQAWMAWLMKHTTQYWNVKQPISKLCIWKTHQQWWVSCHPASAIFWGLVLLERLDGLECDQAGASKLCWSPLLPSHPPTQLSTKLSQEAAIWASTPFNSLPILGLTTLALPIRLHLKSVSIPGYNKGENIHLCNI